MTRVLFVVSRLQRGGLESVLLAVASGLAGRGFEFRIAALTGPGERDGEFRDAGIAVDVLPGRASLSPLSAPANLACFDGLRRLMAVWRPRVVQTHHFFSGVLGRLAARASGVPFVVQAEHNLYLWKGPLALAADRRLAGLTHRFVCPSETVAAHVSRTQRVERSRIEVISNGLEFARDLATRDEARDRLGLPRDGRVVAFVGRLAPPKRPGLFLAMARELTRLGSGARFCMVGTGPLQAECRDQALRTGLEGRMVLAGSVPDAARWMRAFDVVVSCSSEEGFGLAVAEALLAGVPVVAVDTPALRELLEPEGPGGLVTGPDPAGLAARVAEILERPAEAVERARRRGDELARRCTPGAMLDSYEKLYGGTGKTVVRSVSVGRIPERGPAS